MAPLRVSTTKSEWLPDDPTAFVPTRLWKLPSITTWDDSRNQNRPTDSAEEAKLDSSGLRGPQTAFWEMAPPCTCRESPCDQENTRCWKMIAARGSEMKAQIEPLVETDCR